MLYYFTLYWHFTSIPTTSLLNTPFLSVLCKKPEVLYKWHDSTSFFPSFWSSWTLRNPLSYGCTMSEKPVGASRKCYVLERWPGWSPSPAWWWPKAARSNGEDGLRSPDGLRLSKEAAAIYQAQLISPWGCQEQQKAGGKKRQGRLREFTGGM